MPPFRKKITRKKPGSGPSKYYFTNETQDAIVAFKAEQDLEKRKVIYVKGIYPAFNSLVENLINVYGFHVLFENKEDLKRQCLVDLYEAICKFDPAKGSKAFAYFNVVAKHWLIMKSKQSAKMLQSTISMDNRDAFTSHEIELIENYKVLPSADEIVTEEEQQAMLKLILERLGEEVKTENEVLCMRAIKGIFESVENLDQDTIKTKRSILIYIRDITKLPPKQLSIVLSSIRALYNKVKKEEMEYQ
jgi:DNA-directed RNA polymerase specialized sigma subunit